MAAREGFRIGTRDGTRDWLKIKWRDQSCMQFEIVAKNKHKKNSVTFRRASFFSANSFFAVSS